MAAKKAAAKKAAARKAAAKPVAAKARKTTTTSKRAAAVEANLGGSQRLRDFLSGAGWD